MTDPQHPGAEGLSGERKAFEAWRNDCFGPMYTNVESSMMWGAWQARAALAAPQAPAAAEVASLRNALLDCARQAEALKRECGMDPESPQAVRNAQYQGISTTAHIALGTIQGPQAPALPAQRAQEPVAKELLGSVTAAPAGEAPKPSVDRKINLRNAERLLEDLMAQCELIGYEKGLAAQAQVAVPAGEVSDFQLESLFDAVHYHGTFGREFRQHAREILAPASRPADTKQGEHQ